MRPYHTLWAGQAKRSTFLLTDTVYQLLTISQMRFVDFDNIETCPQEFG